MDLKKLSLGDQIIGGSGIVLFIASFLTWFKVEVDGLGAFGASASANAWDLGFLVGPFPVLIGLLMVAYVYHFLRTPDRMKVFEQYYMVVLAFALCLFNDPLLYLNVLIPNKYSILASVICNVAYISTLFLFWAVLFPRISIENEIPRTLQMTFWKLVYMGVGPADQVFAVFFTVSFTAVAWAYIDDPASNTPKK